MITFDIATFAGARAALSGDGLRPRYHFAPPANWMNDPNGLIQWRGQTHFFYQFNPFAAKWGDIHWGHAVSEDLVHWRDLPIALAPTPGGCDADGCWTGCAVVDGGVPTFIYTGRLGEREPICLATAVDAELVLWRKDPANPVVSDPPAGFDLAGGFRDPFVWREGAVWKMVVGSGIQERGPAVFLYHSPDLRSWRCDGLLHLYEGGDRGSMWECPNFFPLGDRHVLLVSEYAGARVFAFVGDYDGRTFTPRWSGLVDGGAVLFAPQVLRDAQGRALMFGWIREGRSEAAQLAAGWSGVLSLPRVLTLGENDALLSRPIPELARLRETAAHLHGEITPASGVVFARARPQLEIAATFEVGAGTCGLQLFHTPAGDETTRAGYDAAARRLFIEQLRPGSAREVERVVHELPLTLDAGEPLRLHLFLDGSVIELFANDRCALTTRVYPTCPVDSTRSEGTRVAAFADGDGAHLSALDVWDLRSIWADFEV